MYPKLATKNKCTGCLACIDICKQNAISYAIKDGLRYIKINKSICSQCRQCVQICPIITPVQNANNFKELAFFGGWSLNNNIRLQSASGGAFAELARYMLKLNGIVIGATCENNKVFHTYIKEKDDLYKLTNSKYLQSDTSGIYRTTKNFLIKGHKVLFSGTPCQIAGLYGFLSYKHLKNLITAEIVCHGVPSEDALTEHLKKHNSNQIISFRDKNDGWWVTNSQRTTLLINHKTVKIKNKEDIFYNIFYACLTDRKSCHSCNFSTLPRLADITLADFWGTNVRKEEQKSGVSLILTNNNKGKLYTENINDLYLFNTSPKECFPSNPRIYNGKNYIQFHPYIIFRNQWNKILPASIKLSIQRNKMPWKLVWAIFKISTIINNKRQLKKILTKLK